MLSIGIQFGEGFDKNTIQKLIVAGRMPYNFDFLVIGTNPGGLACAKEASKAGKKVGVLNLRILSPAENEGCDEDLQQLAISLGVNEQLKNNIEQALKKSDSNPNQINIRTDDLVDNVSSKTRKNLNNNDANASRTKWTRKMRQSRIDLENVLTNLSSVGRKLMHNAAGLLNPVNGARDCGWKIEGKDQMSLDWNKLTDQILDYIMLQNWKFRDDLREMGIECIEGPAVFLNEHNLRVRLPDGIKRDVSAEIICIAMESQQVLPSDIPGAEEYGITCDDFVRIEEPPGKTLIVGCGPVGVECAGIIAGLKQPVKLMYKSSDILKGFDREITEMIVEDMKEKGVVFMGQSTLSSIKLNNTKDKLLVTYKTWKPKQVVIESDSAQAGEEAVIKEEFDTVLFAVGTRVPTEKLHLDVAGIEPEPTTGKIYAPNEQTNVPHIYAVGDVMTAKLENYEAAELAGKLLGKRLFCNESTQMDYDMLGVALHAPTEYAFVGISEDGALSRFGVECIQIYSGSYKPLDFIVPPKKGKCLIKVIVLKTYDWIIGIHFFGPDAGEIIQGFVAAIKCGLTLNRLQTTVGIHLTKAREIVRLESAKNLTKYSVIEQNV